MSQLTLTGDVRPIPKRNIKNDLSENEFKLWNLLRHNPKTFPELRDYLHTHPIPGLSEVSDLERMLRRIRGIVDPVTKRPLYLRSFSQKRGLQKWEAF